MAKRAGTEDADLGNHTHNDPPPPLTDQDLADLLLVHLRDHRLIDKAMDDAMEVVRGIRKNRNRLRSTIKTDGFLLKYVDEVLTDEKRARHEADDDAKNRTFIRKVARQPITGDDNDQIDLFSVKTTKGDVSMDDSDAVWAGRAMAVAMAGGNVNPADNGVPPERLQAWEQGLIAGYETFDLAKKRVEEINARREGAAA